MTTPQPEIKVGTKIKSGVIVAVLSDGVMFDHNQNPEPIKLSFNAIESMCKNDQEQNI